MTKTFDMQFIRYMNLLSRIARVSAKHCFNYNNMIVFTVAPRELEQAIGKDSLNLKKLSQILGKRIRVIAAPKNNEKKDIEDFLKVLIAPTEFQEIEIANNDGARELKITAGGLENKSMLIGRQRAREKELREIIEQYFGIKAIRIL